MKLRNAEMVLMRRQGMTLQQIGDHYGICRERVRQLLVGEPVPLKGHHYRRFFRAVTVAARLQFRDDNGGTSIEHGTRSRYTWGCRCAACTQANRDHMATLRLRSEPPTHSASGYQNFGCRCSICTEAHRMAERAYWQRRRERAV